MNIINKMIVMTLACTVASFNASCAYCSNDSMGFDAVESSPHNPWRILGRLEAKTENIAIALSEFKTQTNEQFKRVDERFDAMNTSVEVFRSEMMSRFDRLEAMIAEQLSNVTEIHIAHGNKTDARLEKQKDHCSYRVS
jgi:hypothetical protein